VKVFVLFMCFVTFVAAQSAAQPRDLDIRASLSQTALWVADRVTYTITIACNKGVDILADDLSKDKLRAEGVEILASETERATGPDDRTVYAFRYILTTYRVDLPALTIAPVTVRYYVKRAGQRVGDAAPAGEVQVPAAVIAFRSALPDGQESYSIRDARDLRPRRLRYAWLQTVGVGLIVLSIVPGAVAAMAVVRRARPRQKPRSARQVRQDERESLEALQALDVSTTAGRRDAYSRVNALVRDHLHAISGLDASGLTPAEINAALHAHDGRVPLELATTLLGACDQARYAPPDAVPSGDACRQAIEQAAQVLDGRSAGL
jgi:hypothetical protein